MNKKIASELAVGIILLISIIVGGIFWVSEQKQAKISATSENHPAVEKTNQTEDACKSHYYEGESEIHGWIASSEQNDEKSIIIQIKNDDIKKLPIKDAEISENFTVRLIDPTSEVKGSLSLATEEKPAVFTVKGYAEICHQEPPQISLEQATKAFKKS